MFTDVMQSVLSGVTMTSAFCIFMFFCILSNTLLGAAIATKTETFDKKVFFNGIKRNIAILLGVDVLAAGFSGLAKLIEVYGIALEYSAEIQGFTTLGIVLIILTLSYKVYGKQALDKIKSLGDLKDEDIIPIAPAEGWEQRGK